MSETTGAAPRGGIIMSVEGLVRVSAVDLRRLERAIRERFDDRTGLMERKSIMPAGR